MTAHDGGRRCLSSQRIGALLGGARLREPERAHLAACESCREALEPLSELEGEIAAGLARAAGALRPQGRELALRIAELAPLVPRCRRRAPMWLALLYASAAAALLLAWFGYAVLARLEAHRALVHCAHQNVRNVALALRRQRGAQLPRQPVPLAVDTLRTTGLEPPSAWRRGPFVADPFGRALLLGHAAGRPVVYSVGPNGRDENGAGDDIAFALR